MSQLLADLAAAPVVVKIAAVGFTVLAGLGCGLVVRAVRTWFREPLKEGDMASASSMPSDVGCSAHRQA